MSPLRSRRAKGRRNLDFYQRCKLQLGYDYGPYPPAFGSEDEQRTTWFEFRAELLEHNPERGFWGRRPWAFWAYEHPELLEDNDDSPIDPLEWGIAPQSRA